MFEYFPFSFFIYIIIFFVVVIGIIVGLISFFINRNRNNMDPNQTQIRPRATAKDVLLNLGAFITLYVLLGNLLSLLFTVINTAYPKVTNGYNYYGSSSISWPVATLVVLLPIFMILMWFLERQYRVEGEMQNSVIHKGLTYLTLFISGCVVAGDLITVVYYFIDGQELTTGFLLKVAVLLVIFSSLFIYYISDLRKKLTKNSRMAWRVIAGIIVIGSIVWGFSVLGSPRTQRLIKYDEQKVSYLQNLDGQIENFYSTKGVLPNTIDEVNTYNQYYPNKVDPQTGKPYEYQKTSETTYNLCAEFNKSSNNEESNGKTMTAPIRDPYNSRSWVHPAGHYCFEQTINPDTYRYTKPVPIY
ncbi:hypothetical protein A2738_00760 [Candidatus Nomurabacteria bacterium RIFCSPHIGHO2_01_FULL_42_15]|uniref:DUF5671 domain-containing protein n=1 Tax=Candidatus Nomurabacteria bacterium RIFCSPHIGHO2_01_FULL_42_15 TaxID=1801742 RepID=A0A1F6VFQ0_9BACT|nr:MAG: hypothetical protein A2738_00760 [Candidatus Nomurabacteria bacterium RIFCSPHIGHO2_01_FULL_42_15]OGI93171.1 MAG: hypothetical protein A3A99_01410 [Candidatus Nomurabacteria bacterium RIFCSPLOWO2_01_FULL_41_18]